MPDRRFYSLRSKKSCRCQHGISAHNSRKTPQGRTHPCWFPGCRRDDSCLGQRQLNRIFKNYLALANEARLERGAIPMRPKKSADGVKWTPLSIHSLKLTAGSIAADKGATATDIKMLLGHRSLQIPRVTFTRHNGPLGNAA